MMNKQTTLNTTSFTPKDTLVIIGNGFDIWQGLHTGYNEFKKYYHLHRDNIMKRLRIKKKKVQDENGQDIMISDVELIYGDPFNPGQLNEDFWSTFEASLDKLNAERLNLFFGKNQKGLRKMRKSIRNADKILREAFCDWIEEIEIDSKDTSYQFGDNCLFINFNYTDTLLKRFKVKKDNIFHIHGEAKDRSSIIYGHSTHPHLPESSLYQFGGRFRGLYFVEEILYMTDKHVQDNIQSLSMFLGIHGVMPEDITNVYVLGHSMGLPDIEYFAFLISATKVHQTIEYNNKKDDLVDSKSIDALYNRIQYAINNESRSLNSENVNPLQVESIQNQYLEEQDARNLEFQEMFIKQFDQAKYKYSDKKEQEIVTRKVDATWHITYHSENDKKWAKALLKELGCKKFQLYPTIDECLFPFKII